jgi:hypothetical protein
MYAFSMLASLPLLILGTFTLAMLGEAIANIRH